MNILAIFPHPDDELGCIGTLHKHVQRGDTVKLLWTTRGEMASQFVDNSREEVQAIREEHGRWVAEQVGASFDFLDMEDSRMTGSRDEALQIARIYATFKPDAILTWDDASSHPDHRAMARIAFDAITLARIPKIVNEGLLETLEAHRNGVSFYQYYVPSSSRPIIHVDVSEQLEVKVKTFEYYRDFYGWKAETDDFLSRLKIRGAEAGVKYAEKFQLRRSYLHAQDFLR